MDYHISSSVSNDRSASSGRLIHGLFEVTVLVKLINAVWEIAAGLLLLFLHRFDLAAMIAMAADYSKLGTAAALAAGFLQKQSGGFSMTTQHFVGLYLLFYGAANLFLAASLLKGRLWAYPLSVAAFSVFTLYLLYRSLAHRSALLLGFTLFDAMLACFVWIEYRRIKKIRPGKLVKDGV
jgi:uncharacterized membrane protein